MRLVVVILHITVHDTAVPASVAVISMTDDLVQLSALKKTWTMLFS